MWSKRPWISYLSGYQLAMGPIQRLPSMNKVLGIALAGAALYGLVRILRMQNVSDLTTLSLVNPRVHQVTLAGLFLRTEVAVNNTSQDSVKVTKPVVTLTSKGKFLTQSVAENKTIEILPLSVTQIDTIEIVLNWSILTSLVSNLLQRIPAVVASFKKGNSRNLLTQLGVPLEMYFTTYVNGLFYQSPPTKILG